MNPSGHWQTGKVASSLFRLGSMRIRSMRLDWVRLSLFGMGVSIGCSELGKQCRFGPQCYAQEVAHRSVASPLADAIERKEFEKGIQWIEAGIDVGASQADGMTPLHWSVYFEQPQLVDLLLKKGAKPNQSNRYGVRPLELACLNGNEAIVRSLLQAGADPNSKASGGETL